MTAATTHILEIPCPVCGDPLVVSYEMRLGAKRFEDEHVVLDVCVTDLELVGGCEHAERAREL
jgi:hypothetical protein